MKKIQSSRQTWTRRTKIVTPCAHDGADHPPISTCFQENVLKWSRQTAVDTGFCSGGHWAGVFAEQESATQDGWLQLLGGQEGGQVRNSNGISELPPNTVDVPLVQRSRITIPAIRGQSMGFSSWAGKRAAGGRDWKRAPFNSWAGKRSQAGDYY